MSTANAAVVVIDDASTAAKKRIATSLSAIAMHTACINDEQESLRGVNHCISKLTDVRAVHNANIATWSASIAENKAVVEEAGFALVAAEDAKWLESVFEAPASAAGIRVDFSGSYKVCKRRLALLTTDPRRLDKRHCVTIYDLEGEIDLTPFSNARRVSLTYLPNIVDVSALAGVEHVSLVRTPNVSDVSSLRGVRTLHLEGLPLVDNAGIVMLRGVHELLLNRLSKVTDVSPLRGVHTLELCDMSKVADVSSLCSVESLGLTNMPLVTDISALECVPNLHVFLCHNIQSVKRGKKATSFA